MPRQVFVFDPPERFVTGTVGQPGERAFYLQARGDSRLVTVALEKAQVKVLTDRLTQMLGEVRRRGVGAEVLPEPVEVATDTAPLEQPIDPEFTVGAMSLAWDGESRGGSVVVQAHEITEDAEEVEYEADQVPDPEVEGPAVLFVRLEPGQAREFVARATRLVAAGRPPCPLCSLPLEPTGHICPRQNGHRR